jgi:hypothetical protein
MTMLVRFRWLGLLLFGIVSVMLIRGDSVASAQKQPSYQLLRAKVTRFLEYSKDFHDFAKSSLGAEPEFGIAEDLYTVSSEAYDYFDAASTFVEIYDGLSCKEDRAQTQLLIDLQLAYYSHQTGVLIEEANLDIAHVEHPGIGAEASWMRDDLREAKSLLDSIKLAD